MKAAKDKRVEPPPQENKPRPGQPDPAVNYAVPVDGRPAFRPRGRAGHDHRVLGLPVPVLQPRQPDDEADQGDLPEGRARRLPPAAAQLPRPRPPGRQGVARGGAAGQVLGDARQAVREPEGARRQVARDLREADRASTSTSGRRTWPTRRSRPWSRRTRPSPESSAPWHPRGFVNGRFLSGAQPFEAFDKVIKEEKRRPRS
jgi:hypothetical protein